MHIRGAIFAALAVASCDGRATNPECAKAEWEGNIFDASPECFDDAEIELLSGYLISYPEFQIFTAEIPDVDSIYDDPRTQTWVYFPDDFHVSNGVYEVEMLGKRSVRLGAYGHLNLFGQAISVESLENIERQRISGMPGSE